jgi:hypothetical protein
VNRRRAQPRVTWLGRMARGLRPDRNPLRRGSDRAEAAIKVGLLAAFLALAPVAVATAIHVTYTATARTVQAEHSSWRQVPAVLLHNAHKVTGYGMFPQAPVLVEARWTAPDGSRHTGEVFASRGAPADSTVMVWTDASGHLTGPLLPRSAPGDRESFAAASTLVAMALVLACCETAARRMLDRRRLAAWEADWAVTEPRWTTRR